MPGVIVPFETREARNKRLASIESKNTNPTPEERHVQYRQHTLTACRQLLKYYKESSHWTVDCENEMSIAVEALSNICRLLAASPPEVSQ